MQTTTFRKAKKSDVGAIKACVQAAYAPYTARLDGMPDVVGGVEADMEDHDVWVLEDKGVVGVLVVSTSKHPRMHIVNIAVDPAEQGKGLGKRLLNKAEQLATSLGADSLVLGTHADMSDTLAFYRAAGFEEQQRHGTKVVMTKWLGVRRF